MHCLNFIHNYTFNDDIVVENGYITMVGRFTLR